MSRDDEAVAPTVVQPDAVTVPDRASARAIDADRTGELVGRYRLVERLGAGAMGVVWAALDPQLDRKVAIKLVHPRLARSPDASGRLLREARAMAKVQHPAVVTVHDSGDVDGQLFLAMELVQGTTLGAMLRTATAGERADWQRWFAIMLEAGRGLAAAHKAGVLHRDFKPDNVLVDRTGRVCVADFGLASLGEQSYATTASARWASRDPDPELELTTTGALLGTPAYMSPQQLRGEPIDARADQFAFCVALHEAVYGKRPFQVVQHGLDAIPALVEQIETQRFEEMELAPTVPERVRAVLRRGLASAPDDRWPDLDTLLEELARAARHRAPSITAKRERSRAAPIAAAVAGLAIAGGVAVWSRGGAGREASATMDAAPTVQATRLFSVSGRSPMALSPDAKRVALASDFLEVRDLSGPGLWRASISPDEVVGFELTADEVRFGSRRLGGYVRWRYLEKAPLEEVVLGGWWHARSAIGDVVQFPEDREFRTITNGKVTSRWSTAARIEVTAMSPDRRRFAYLEAGRFKGTILVRNLESGTTIRMKELVAPTALAWIDDRELAYSTGIYQNPTIFRVEVGPTAFGSERVAYREPKGWFGQLEIRNGHVLFSKLDTATRAKVIDRKSTVVTDHDRAAVSAVLGWTDRDELLTWNADRKQVDRRTRTRVEVTSAKLASEPANATLAGDTLIAALRHAEGREVVALSLATGVPAWRKPIGELLAVRCAGDLGPPCFAIRSVDGAIMEIDPVTGAMASKAIRTGEVEDIAVRLDGKRITIAALAHPLTEIDATTGDVVRVLRVPLSTMRSVAYDPRGGLLVTGTVMRNHYQVAHVDDAGTYTKLAEVFDDMLSLVRPARLGTQVQVLARTYATDAWMIRLPQRD